MIRYEDVDYQFKATIAAAEECGRDTKNWYVDDVPVGESRRYRLSMAAYRDLEYSSLRDLCLALESMEQAYNSIIDLKG